MPLYIGEDAYEEVRGPCTLTLLRPKHEPDVTFLLLGETHDFDRWEPCTNAACANIQTDFVKSLDKFASRYPVTLFLEDFFDDIDHQRELPERQKTFYRYRTIELEESVLFNKKDKLAAWQIAEYEINSPMVELSRLYTPCFYPELTCPYPHIKWQYADARKQNKLTHSSVTSLIPVYNEMIAILYKYRLGREVPEYPATLLRYKDSTWEYDFMGGITSGVLTQLGKQANVYLMDNAVLMKRERPVPNLFLEMLTILRDILVESDDAFAEKLFHQKGVVHDQYMSLPTELRSVFHKKSSIKLQQFYKQKFPDKEEEHAYVVELLTLLIEFYHMEPENPRRKEIASQIEGMNYSDDQHDFISRMFIYYTAIVLDLYFILRSYNRRKEQKLVVGYFGSAHVDAQIHYLTQVVKTHTIEFRSEGEGRVRIDPPIYLEHTEGKRARSRKRVLPRNQLKLKSRVRRQKST